MHMNEEGEQSVVHVEAGVRVIKTMAEWMLDAIVCSVMKLGEP